MVRDACDENKVEGALARMKNFINVGLLGAGTVGGGVIKVLEKNAADIEKKVGKPIRITKVLDRNV